MDSINTIINSKKFQREAPEPLKLLIRRMKRESLEAEATAEMPLLPSDKIDRADRQPNQTITESKNKNAA